MNKTSIVTVTYNNLYGLRKTVNSVVHQKKMGADIEFIVIDGLSEDGTFEYISEQKEIVDIFVCEKDSGIFNAMNKGLYIASGVSVLFLNAGDVFFHDFNLKRFQEKYNLNDKTVFTSTIQEYENLKFIRPKRNKCKFNYFDFGHQGVFATKSDYKAVKYNEELIVSADSVWQKEIWERNNYIIANDISTCFSLGGVSNNYSNKNKTSYTLLRF